MPNMNALCNRIAAAIVTMTNDMLQRIWRSEIPKTRYILRATKGAHVRV